MAGGTLGCGENSAYVATKCNTHRLCELTDADRIYYERVLDDISEAEVEIPIGGSLEDPCCRCLGDVEPWCHELVIVRDGEVVWIGPIQEVTYTFERVTIRAKDKLAWLEGRVNEGPLYYNLPDEPSSITANSLTDIAEDIIQTAMADEDSACVLDCIINLGDGLPADSNRARRFEAFDGPYAYDLLQMLSESGMDFTVVNQCIILGAEDMGDTLNPITTLTENHVLGDLEIRKDGTQMGTRFWARYDGDTDEATCTAQGSIVTPCPVFADADNAQCYGLIERVIEDNLGIPNIDAARAVAEEYAATGATAPRFIEFPPGARLAPETPWEFNDMIPGQRVDVALSRFCIDLTQSFRLQKVTVEDTPEGEAIGIELGGVSDRNSGFGSGL